MLTGISYIARISDEELNRKLNASIL